MKLSQTLATIAYFSLLAASNAKTVQAENVNSNTATTTGKTQIAYLTPNVALQSSREAAAAAYQAMQFSSALQQYQNVCNSGGNAKDYYWLGESYFHLDRFVEAGQTFEKALALEPRYDAVQVRVVQSYLFAKQTDVAKQKCIAALAVVTDPIVRQQLGVLEQSCTNAVPARLVKGAQKRGGMRIGE